MDLTLVAASVIGFALVMYVLLDGFDLGIGILFLVDTRKEDRDIMMNTITPVWDGNETWLVLGGAGLFAAFPLAYATILPALYIPVMVMLFALVFRGVAFEYRFKSERTQRYWDLSFSAGAAIAGFAQGVMLGAVINGIAVSDRRFVGGAFDWLTPFSLMCGLGLIVGYAMLGATWLILKTDGGVQDWAHRQAKRLTPALAAFVGLVSLWTPYSHPEVARRWFTLPNLLLLAPVPIVTALVFICLWRALHRREEIAPFFLTIAVFLLCFIGLSVSLYPYAVPYTVTIWDAAPQRESQIFLLLGVAVLLPVILAYTSYTYWIFRGKTGMNAGYH